VRTGIVAAAVAVAAGACTSVPAVAPPHAPAFTDYTGTSGRFTVRIPAAWTRTTDGDASVFTGGSASIRVEQIPYGSASTEASFRADELPALSRNTPGFRLQWVGPATVPAGRAVLAEYTETVAGTAVVEEARRYELWQADQRMVLTLAASADHLAALDPVIRSFRWRL
jgi:hypothetical protein